MLKFIFFASTFVVLYIFIGYPLLLALWARLSPAQSAEQRGSAKQSGAGDGTDVYAPPISIIIAAHNEAHHVEQRLNNILAQDYDLTKVQIIVGSDGSTDGTVDALESFRDRVVATGARYDILKMPDRGGKSRILNTAVPICANDIIVFADMRQTFSANTLANLARRFVDPNVGAVSGELFLADPNADPGANQSGADMGAYWRYEKIIRKLEAKVHSTVGATGAIYAIRKSLFKPVPEQTLIEDVVIPMQICMQGHRVLFADDAQAFDVAASDGRREWLRKVRTLAGNWQLFKIRPEFLNPVKNPVWLQFMSHKLLRLALPFCLLLMFLTSYRIEGPTYTLAFTLQCLAYMLAIACFFSDKLAELRIPSLVYFFCILNAAIVVGLLRLVSGRTGGLWAFAYKDGAENSHVASTSEQG